MTTMMHNDFLDQLAEEDGEALRTVLSRVAVPASKVVIRQAERLHSVYFPITALLANVIRTAEGEGVLIGLVGREGLTGVGPLITEASATWDVECVIAGDAWVGRADDVLAVAQQRPEVMRRMLSLSQFYRAQTSYTASCNALHPIYQRLARWLLTMQDIARARRFYLTQEQWADRLGAQRTTMVSAFDRLTKAKALSKGRNWCEITSRGALLANACSCYSGLRSVGEDLGFFTPAGENHHPSEHGGIPLV